MDDDDDDDDDDGGKDLFPKNSDNRLQTVPGNETPPFDMSMLLSGPPIIHTFS